VRIVVLDGYTLNPGDLDWADLASLGECDIHDRTPPESVVARAREAEIVFVNKVRLPAEVIRQLPKLRYIGVLATGYDTVDARAAAQRGIVVTNIPAYGTASVAQMVFAHILNLTQHVAQHAHGVAAGRWSEAPDFCYWDHPLIELAGQTLGIVGLGRIGRATAEVAQAFGMKVIGYDAAIAERAAEGVTMVELDALFRDADVVSLHCPLTPETRHLVDARRLALMKPTALLINTARGPLIDEKALANRLNTGLLAGAGLDVLCEEPPRADHPLLSARNCYITPHLAWATRAARQRLMGIAVENVRAFLEDRPKNVVNRPG